MMNEQHSGQAARGKNYNATVIMPPLPTLSEEEQTLRTAQEILARRADERLPERMDATERNAYTAIGARDQSFERTTRHRFAEDSEAFDLMLHPPFRLKDNVEPVLVAVDDPAVVGEPTEDRFTSMADLVKQVQVSVPKDRPAAFALTVPADVDPASVHYRNVEENEAAKLGLSPNNEMKDSVSVPVPPVDDGSIYQITMWATEHVEREVFRLTRVATRHRVRLERANALIRQARQQTPLTCPACNSTHSLGDLEYIQTYWYESPHGCTGGDTWHSGEGQYRCGNPECQVRVRLFQRPDLEKLRELFHSITQDKDSHRR